VTNWDERAAAHAASTDYGVDRFPADPGYLSGVVRSGRPRLGDRGGLRGVHLQCHIGTGTVCLSRLGARMSGLDFSAAALAEARRRAASTGRWARAVAGLLRPGGRLLIREGHPMLGSLDDQSDRLSLRYPYFEHAALPGHMMLDGAGEWRLAEQPGRLAASYTLQAVKE
jgi:hypothetical protein